MVGSVSGFSASFTPPVTGKSEADRKAKSDLVVAEFMAEVKKTPIERIKETIHKKYGLTNDKVASLSKEQLAAIEQEIQIAIQCAFGGSGGDTATVGAAQPGAMQPGAADTGTKATGATASGTHANVLA